MNVVITRGSFLLSFTSTIALLLVTIPHSVSAADDHHYEYPPYDGWYNNFAHPEWGAAETPLLRQLPPAYGDGVYAPSGANRPNPLSIAAAVFDGDTGHPSYRNRTALLVFFGQQLVEEILDAQGSGCPPEYFNIPIPKNHGLFDPDGHGGREIPLLRTRYDARTGHSPNVPREQLNEVTPFFDGNLMYGPNKAWSDTLRLFKDGLLAATNDSNNNSTPPSRAAINNSSDLSEFDQYRYFPARNDIRLPFANPPPPRDHKLKPIRRFFKIGNPRGNENPFLLTFGILWFRYHNFRARQLKANHPNWDDEQLFNEARKWVIAVHQNIVYNQWLPAWLDESLPPYKGYNPQIHPQIAHVFQSAAMRFGHTLVPPGVYRRNANCEFRTTTKHTGFEGHRGVRTCNSYWNPQDAIREYDIDELLMGMASQIAEREDHIVTPDLHGHVFGTLEFSRRDLMAVNIQRGRDHGLPDYNTAREFYGLPRVTRFEDINNSTKPESLRAALLKVAAVYNNSMDDVDIWPAGMLETTERGPGPLFRRIIMDQFSRIRDGDRFWFENNRVHKLFTDEEVREIKSITLKDIIIAVTRIPRSRIQNNVFFHVSGDPCPQPVQLNPLEGHMENCTRVKSYDYFRGSELPYIITIFCELFSAVVFIGILMCVAQRHKRWVGVERQKLNVIKKNSQQIEDRTTTFAVVEWIGHKQGTRAVALKMDVLKKRITLHENRSLVRVIDLSTVGSDQAVHTILSADVNMKMILLRVPKDYDLVLIHEAGRERQTFINKLKDFLKEIDVKSDTPESMSEKMMKKAAVTRDVRKATLDRFFSAVVAHALKYKDVSLSQYGRKESQQLINCELTKYEFASSLGLQVDSMFVTNMFKLVDKNENGFISFREFLDFFVIFSKGTADDKARIMFDMYDLEGNGKLSKMEFKSMLRSMVELANEKIEENKIDDLINSLFSRSGFDNKTEITFENFRQMMNEYRDDLNVISLSVEFGETKIQTQGKRENASVRAQRTFQGDKKPMAKGRTYTMRHELKTIEKSLPQTKVQLWRGAVLSFFENYRRHIFWVSLYTLVLFGVFVERAYVFWIEREVSGLRRICGYGVAITRGAANAMMFTYSSLLVTMCRNVITFLRDTFLHQYIPFDEAVSMHKYIAYWAGFFTLVHIVGHCFNIYGISSQTPNDVACLFRNYFHPTDEIPTFTRWCWRTLTGTTGMALTVQFFLIFVFATPYARRHAFRAFWVTHLSYPVFFILMLVHGSGRMIQAPFTYYFVLGPIILFAVDQVIRFGRRKVEITVVKSELLPSDVTHLELKKPLNFEYKSGQWIRLACLARGKNEYHPFTLTSAPHEENLKVHIRAVGPWTLAIRRLYDTKRSPDGKLPKVYIDGPYGEGNQDWHRYDVSILIGGGIGVTPFASILKDIAEKSRQAAKITCKKVYFIWVTRTQSHFEWLTDILREVEEKDTRNLINIHVFITQFKERFDIRTTMLYICEKYFQKLSDKSLFTGLQAITHFGRPDFNQLLQMIGESHSDTNVFGVFSCGPPPLTQSVDKACAHENKYTRNVLFEHHNHNI